MSGVYLGVWEPEGDTGGFAAMVADFTPQKYDYDKREYVPLAEPVVDPALEPHILVAAYEYENYEGSALVIFEQDGKLYEVVGGHCSCYGLSESSYSGETDSQWDPEETTAAAILMRTRYIDSEYSWHDDEHTLGPIDTEIRRIVTAWAVAHGEPIAPAAAPNPSALEPEP